MDGAKKKKKNAAGVLLLLQVPIIPNNGPLDFFSRRHPHAAYRGRAPP